jgi:UDP-N-acetylglucosamine:LPS N-acetylglucosamine transferase
MEYHHPNAQDFEAGCAATILDETEVTGSLEDALVEQLEPLIVDDARRQKMAASMRRLARPGAAANVTNIVYEALFNTSVRLAA